MVCGTRDEDVMTRRVGDKTVIVGGVKDKGIMKRGVETKEFKKDVSTDYGVSNQDLTRVRWSPGN